MTDQGEGPSREEAFYEAATAFLKRYGFMIAIAAPVVFVSLVPVGAAAPLVILVAYLGEAIIYSAIRRAGRGRETGRGVRSGPGPGLQVLYGLLATLLIIGGIFGLGSASPSPPILPILAISLGIGIVAWVWQRVARASGEHSSTFAAGIATTMGRAGGSVARMLVARLILVAVVAGAAWLISIVTNIFGGS
jgi:hypothetical protein